MAAIVEASRDAIWSWDLEGTITAWNGEAERLFGFRAEEIVGQSLLVMVPPERMALARDAVTKLKTGDWIGQYKTERLRKNGTRVPVELTVSPIRDAEGQIVGAATVCRDITERQQFEEALAQRMNELAVLYSVTDNLHRANSIEDIYAAALDAIVAALRCQRASILLFDDADIMRFVACRGLSDDYCKAVEGHSPWTPDVSHPDPICVSDIDQSDEAAALKAIIKAEGIRALCFTPLVANGKLIGKFMTYYSDPHAFSREEIQLALTIARQVAFSVERMRAVERESILGRELQHRSNNLLAVIQSIATNTLSGAHSLQEASKILAARLNALARANQQLSNSNWAGHNLKDIVSKELEPFAGRTTIDGGNILLNPRYTQSFSLALHELATNAVKHGALSDPAGKIAVTWRVTGGGNDAALHFQWSERGGPAVAVPQKAGFGTSLLKASLNGARVDYQPQGLDFQVALPLRVVEPVNDDL